MQERIVNFKTLWNKKYTLLKYFFLKISHFFLELRIKSAKNCWFISKNRNFYNSILRATVFQNGYSWRIARFRCFFGRFENKEDAMNEIFQIWLKDNNFNKIFFKVNKELGNLKHEILSMHKYKILE